MVQMSGATSGLAPSRRARRRINADAETPRGTLSPSGPVRDSYLRSKSSACACRLCPNLHGWAAASRWISGQAVAQQRGTVPARGLSPFDVRALTGGPVGPSETVRALTGGPVGPSETVRAVIGGTVFHVQTDYRLNRRTVLPAKTDRRVNGGTVFDAKIDRRVNGRTVSCVPIGFPLNRRSVWTSPIGFRASGPTISRARLGPSVAVRVPGVA